MSWVRWVIEQRDSQTAILNFNDFQLQIFRLEKGGPQMRRNCPEEEYIEEYQFQLIRQTGIKHKPNIEVRASQK